MDRAVTFRFVNGERHEHSAGSAGSRACRYKPLIGAVIKNVELSKPLTDDNRRMLLRRYFYF
ncbi:hypothetical protein PCAR4_60119 [Paraburkholderia caribensis]|nr:hypothetical protein PCAR4_60119 [Paraburkholderia caribensis]